MQSLKGRRILFQGASTYFMEAAQYAKDNGAYIIAIDIRPKEEMPVKQIADEEYLMSTIDIPAIEKLVKERNIDGIYPGASEKNIPVQIKIAQDMGLPMYCTPEQWSISTNKAKFKQACRDYDIPVTHVYSISDPNDINEVSQLPFPVVTKPVDNNGSTGITIVETPIQFYDAYRKAISASKCGYILIEKRMNFANSMIAHYTVQNGEVVFSGLTDKESKKISEDAAPVMSIQFIPSEYTEKFKDQINEKIVNMLKGLGVKYGPIWIEIFYDDGQFICNEVGYRYGGSMTYYPVEYFFGINQMHLLVHYLATGEPLYEDFANTKIIEERLEHRYCILPMQVRAGKISQIQGLRELINSDYVYGFIQSHIAGDLIEATGTTHQVFGYIHLTAENMEVLQQRIRTVNNTLKVLDEDGNNMLDILYCRK